MGMFDTIIYQDRQMNEIEIQIKFADCILKEYHLGDEIDAYDGIYFGYKEEGCFVVWNDRIIAIFSSKEPCLFNKRGERMIFIDIEQHPLL